MVLYMRVLQEDMRDPQYWKRYRRRADSFYAARSTTGAVYYNAHDSSNSTTTYKTPILIKDGSGSYWTITEKEFMSIYEGADGKDISRDEIKTNEFTEVQPKEDPVYWAFHVGVRDYGWDCKYGANATDISHGDGDYLMCKGDSRPDLRTVKVIHNKMFTRLYEEDYVC